VGLPASMIDIANAAPTAAALAMASHHHVCATAVYGLTATRLAALVWQ
jgi:hypothetical protein